MTCHGLASLIALAGSVQVAAEVELDISNVSGRLAPDTQKKNTIMHRTVT